MPTRRISSSGCTPSGSSTTRRPARDRDGADRAACRGSGDVEVRRVETDDELYEADRIAAVAFEMASPPKRRPYVPDPNSTIYLAYADGRPVARGSASFGEGGVTLFGGSTLPEARGRGAYRALVAARWEDAVARGTPVLVTQAGPMSRPILVRLGFREVCEIRMPRRPLRRVRMSR